MAATVITLGQMLSRPMVRGVYSRVKTAPAMFQEFFRMRPTDAATISGGLNRTFAYDLFEHSLTMAQARAPKIGPARIAPKPTGSAFATILRSYESIPFAYGDVFGLRGLGTMELDLRGQGWVARQQMYMAERQINMMEFAISRMWRGGFGVLTGNESFILTEKGSGTVDVEYPIPATNINQLDGTVDATWANAGTKIINQFLNINAMAERQTGFPIRHVFVNSVTYAHLLANTQLQVIRGTAMPVFANFRENIVATTGSPRSVGFDVMFPTMPLITFHVYDGVSVVATQTDPEDRTTSNTTKYIPDGIAIMTPEPDPGGWHGMATCGEPIRETDETPVEIKEGLDTWSYPINDPPGEELRVLNNFLPILMVPKAVFYATVVF